MEGLLNAFQSDLGNISSEIQNLQEQSTLMNVKLKNRKVHLIKITLYSFLPSSDTGSTTGQGSTGHGYTTLYDKVMKDSLSLTFRNRTHTFFSF